MIQQTAPMTLLELVDRIKEKSNDTLLSTISANGGKAEIKSIAPLETAGHGDVAFLANSRYRDAAAACKATALVLTEEDKQAIWGKKNLTVLSSLRAIRMLGLHMPSKSFFRRNSRNRALIPELL